MNKVIPFLVTCFFTFLSHFLSGQTYVSGVVSDMENGETVIGAKVVIKGTLIGTITDINGNFSLATNYETPFTLEVSSIGYETEELVIFKTVENFGITMSATEYFEEEVVVSASRIEERIMEAPVSIQKLSLLNIRYSPSGDIYGSLAQLKGVQINTGSLLFPSINTRGFGDMQNWRFVQRIDGVEMNLPGLNYPIGNINGTSDLDIRSIEIVPGTGSALYGPNAFNGSMDIYTKSPFEYQGLSAVLKTGALIQKGVNTRPVLEAGLRFGHKVDEKFAWKLDLTYLNAYDWQAEDNSFHITPARIPIQDSLLSLPRTHPNFDAVNVYGDEVQVPVFLGDSALTLINRTGIREQDIIDYKIDHLKVTGAMHFRPNPSMELIYAFRYVEGDAILRHTTVYPFVNVTNSTHKLELKGKNYFFRTYYSGEDAKDSYAMLATGAFIQEGLKSSQAWSQDYSNAYLGNIQGVVSGDHEAARLFADRDLPGPESETFQLFRTATLTNPEIASGGSQFIDKTRMVHAEGMYDFSPILPFASIQIGGHARNYFLDSEGQVFNDGVNGFGEPISILEYGGYLQASKKLFDDVLNLRGSIRYDKNPNFEGQLTPRLSAVINFGTKQEHFIRVSAQTGFRNPAAQEAYIALDVRDLILLGGTLDNISNYNYMKSDGSSVNGLDIFNNLVTIPSFLAFSASGGQNAELLEPSNVQLLQQEQISTAEFGYKGLVDKRLWIDASVYYNIYENFVHRVNAFSLPAQRAFSVYTNIPEQITSYGGGIEIGYLFPSGFRLGGNYDYATFDAEEAIAANPGFLPAFNTPEHRGNFFFENRDLFNGLGFNIMYRYSTAFQWQSPFGQGNIDAYHILDAGLSAKFSQINSMVKVGATNALGQEYRQVYGGPSVGTQLYLTFIYDKFIR